MPPRKSAPENEELRRVRERELELKRISGEISCSDCRRLKLKCDKKIPCSSCIRRGAHMTCPNGQISSSTRPSPPRDAVYSEATATQVQQAKTKMTAMSERIRLLEDALRSSTGPSHTLLSEDLLHIKDGIDSVFESETNEAISDEEGSVRTAFGTLSISGEKTLRYYGRTATDHILLAEAVEPLAPKLTQQNNLSSVLREASRAWPFACMTSASEEDAKMAELTSHLPIYERATSLVESFFGNIAWLQSPIERDQIVEEQMPMFYPGHRALRPEQAHPSKAHDLALLFITFACGAAGDLTQAPMNEEGEKYLQLAKAALAVGNLMQDTSLASVQATMSIGLYKLASGRKANAEEASRIYTLACNLAMSIGLHREPSHWGLSLSMINRRRKLFWEMHVSDSYRSLATGRPSCFAWSSFDCELPTDTFATIEEDGSITEGVSNWRYRFSRDVLSEVTHKLCGTGSVKYREVLELDRKVRSFPVHARVHRPVVPPEDLGRNIEFMKLHPLITAWDREETLLYIHRNHYARAIIEYPANPLRSPFATSFLATYRSSVALLRIVGSHFDSLYLTVLRAWSVWTMLLSSAIVMGVTASLGSSINFAVSAFVELEKAIALFEKADGHIVARHGVVLLKRLREKALKGLHKPARNGSQSSMEASALTPQSKVDAVACELDAFKGSTRLIYQREAPGPNTLRDAPFGTLRSNTASHNVIAASGASRPAVGLENFGSVSGLPNQGLLSHYVSQAPNPGSGAFEIADSLQRTNTNGTPPISIATSSTSHPTEAEAFIFEQVGAGSGQPSAYPFFVDLQGDVNELGTLTHLPADGPLFVGSLNSPTTSTMGPIPSFAQAQDFVHLTEATPSGFQKEAVSIEPYDMVAWQMLMDSAGLANGMAIFSDQQGRGSPNESFL